MFKLSGEAFYDGCTTVENKFISDYLPYADGDYVRVYLYGFMLASFRDNSCNSVEAYARRLNLDKATVDAAIDYWSDLGLMARLGDDIAFMPIRSARPKIKKYDVDKYSEFNRMAQMYISGRQIEPNEYYEYYALMEKLDIEWQAMTLIIKYCVDLKGDNVSRPYILAVARNLATDGYRTHDDVENRLEEYGVYFNDLCEITSALGSGKRPDHEAVGLYKKWLKVYKFDKSVVLAVARTIKRGGIATLDLKLTKYFELELFTLGQIDAYEQERKELYALAKAVNKALGLYYENVDPEISAYIRPWLDSGFEKQAVLAAAEHCMKNGLKTLSDLDAVLRDFLSRGVLTEAAVKADIERKNRFDDPITALMKKLGIAGAVKPTYRAYFTNWADGFGFSADVIDCCAELARGKDNPFAYMNKILTAWHADGITTAEAAKAKSAAAAEAAAANGNTVIERYTADELNAIFTDIIEEDK